MLHSIIIYLNNVCSMRGSAKTIDKLWVGWENVP